MKYVKKATVESRSERAVKGRPISKISQDRKRRQ